MVEQAQTPRDLVAQWRKEEEEHKRKAAAHAPMGGSLYVRHLAMWELSKKRAAELSAVLDAQEGKLAKMEQEMRALRNRLFEESNDIGQGAPRFDMRGWLEEEGTNVERWADTLREAVKEKG